MASEDTLTLAELMLHAERFCADADSLGSRLENAEEQTELRLKLSQCRGFLNSLQLMHNDDQLTIEHPTVRADFRQLILALLWVAFRVRHHIDRKLFRRVVEVEAGFTFLLATRS